MGTYQIKHVDAFTSRPFEGNPAGVVPDARGLREDAMQTLARELNLSETAFILPSNRKDADLRIRWFTPTEEVPLCGHATIASFHALAEEGLAGMKTNGQHYFRLETKSGVLAVKVEKNFRGIGVEFDLPVPRFRVVRRLGTSFLESLDLRTADLLRSMPIVIHGNFYIPVKGLAVLRRMQPCFPALTAACKRRKVQGVCVFTFETVETSSSVHSRFFAPSVGIDEDPVTGSANGPLGVYLATIAQPAGTKIPCRELPDGRTEFIGEQGDEIGRRGRVRIRIQRTNGHVSRVTIGGEAVTVSSGTVNL